MARRTNYTKADVPNVYTVKTNTATHNEHQVLRNGKPFGNPFWDGTNARKFAENMQYHDYENWGVTLPGSLQEKIRAAYPTAITFYLLCRTADDRETNVFVAVDANGDSLGQWTNDTTQHAHTDTNESDDAARKQLEEDTGNG